MTLEVRYPNSIGLDTAVPGWAYLDVVTGDKFDPASAQQAVNLPESTVGSEASTFSSTPSSSTSFETSTLAPEGPNNKSNNTPAIIGGAVGGLFGLSIIVLLILYYLKQGSSKRVKAQFSLPTTRASVDMSGTTIKGSYSSPGGYSTSDTSGPL